jgi:hypothetical protein
MTALGMKFAKAPHNSAFEQAWRQQYGEAAAVPQRYIVGPSDEPAVNALVNREPVDVAGEDLRWHISISRPDRLPSWDDCVAAAHELRPGVCFSIGIPPRSWWINVHPYVLHLFETRDPHLVAMWQAEGRGDRHT